MAKQYTINTFSLEDLKRFNKWKSENPDYNFEAGPVDEIYEKEKALLEFEKEGIKQAEEFGIPYDGPFYKGLKLKAGAQYSVDDFSTPVTDLDAQAYFAKYPHHDMSLSEEKYQQYIDELQKTGGTTLDVDDKVQQQEAEELPEDAPAAPQNYFEGLNPQTKEVAHIVGDPESNHFHWIEVDEAGNGKTATTQITDTYQHNIDVAHNHQISNWKVLPGGPAEHQHTHELRTETLPASYKTQGQQNHKPIDAEGKEEETPKREDPLHKIIVKYGSFPGENPVSFWVEVYEKTTAKVKLIYNIPDSNKADFTEEEINDEAIIRQYTIAYLKGVFEEYPNYELDDRVELMPPVSEVVDDSEPPDPEEESFEEDPGKKAVKEIVFPDDRYSTLLQVGMSHISSAGLLTEDPNLSDGPWDIKTAMGYLLYANEIIKDHEGGEFDWLKLLSKYTIPSVTVRPSDKLEDAKSDDLKSESAKSRSDVTAENSELNDSQKKLQAYNKRKNESIFVGNTIFANMEGNIQKMRGPGLSVETVFGEVLHKINLRSFLMRAMACIIEKMNPGDIAEALCKSLIKALLDEVGWTKVKNILLEVDKELNLSKGFREEVKKATERIEAKYEKPSITGDSPVNAAARRVQKKHLKKNKEYAKAQKQEIDNFVDAIKDFVDLDALCERLGRFVNNAPKLLFAPNGLMKIRQMQVLPELPKLPLIEMPKFNTTDYMDDLLKELEKGIKQLIVESIVNLIRGVMEETMRQCEETDQPGKPRINPERALDIPTLPNRHGAASPLQSDLNPQLLGDFLGIPPERAKELSGLLDNMSDFLKPSELCRLLSGSADFYLLRNVLKRINSNFPKLALYIKDISDVARVFRLLGESVDQSFCGAIVTNLSVIVDLCDDVEDNSIHENSLRQKGFSEDQIKEILENDAKRKKDALAKMASMFINPDALDESPEVFCSPLGPGMTKMPQIVEYHIDRTLDTVFDLVELSYRTDVESVKGSLISPVVREDTRSGAQKMPFQDGVDYPIGSEILSETATSLKYKHNGEEKTISRKYPKRTFYEVVPNLKSDLSSGLLEGNLMFSRQSGYKDGRFEDKGKYSDRTVITLEGSKAPNNVSSEDFNKIISDLSAMEGVGDINPNTNSDFTINRLDYKKASENIVEDPEDPTQVTIKNTYDLYTNTKNFFNQAEDSEVTYTKTKYEIEKEIDPEVEQLIVELLGEDHPSETIKASLNGQSALQCSLPAIVFSKLITRNIKREILPVFSEANPELDSWQPMLKSLATYMEPPIRELFDRYSMLAMSENVFKTTSKASLFNTEEFTALEFIPPLDPDTLKSSRCETEDNAEKLQPTGLIDFSKIKEMTKNNIDFKMCAGEDDDAIASSMKYSICLLVIRLGLIEHILNSLFILTQLDSITETLTSETFMNEFISKFNKKLQSDFSFKESFYEIIIAGLSEQLEQNIKLEGITEENLNRETALKYLSRQTINELVSPVNSLFLETTPDQNISWSFPAFMKLFIPLNRVVDAPGAMSSAEYYNYDEPDSAQGLTKLSGLSARSKQVPGTDKPIKILFEKENQVNSPNIMMNDFAWSNSSELYTNSVFTTNNAAFSEANPTHTLPSHMTNRLNNNGGFMLQKYARIEYLDVPGGLAGNVQPFQIFTWLDTADNWENDYKHEIVAIDELERAIYHNSISDSLQGTDPFWNELKLSNDFKIQDAIKIYFGIRLVYVMPDFNSINGMKNVPGATDYNKRHEITKRYDALLQQIRDINEEGLNEFIFSKASYNLRSTPVSVPADLLNIDIPGDDYVPKEDSAGGYDWSQLLTVSDFKYTYDVNMIPIVSVEKPFEFPQEMGGCDTTYGSFKEATRGGLYATTAVPGYDESFEEEVVPRLYKTYSGTQKKSFAWFDNIFKESYKSDLMTKLAKTPEYKLMQDYLFPMEDFASVAFSYIGAYPKTDVIDMNNIFVQSRTQLLALFDALENNDKFRYMPPGSDQKQNNLRDRNMTSTNMNPMPNLAAIALKTVPMMIKGMAETLDPAYGTATLIQTASGLPPHLVPFLTMALMPPPMFPPTPWSLFPITPIGMAAMGLNFLDPFGEYVKKKSKAKAEDCPDEPIEKEDLDEE